jgi:hypothetical protein
MVSWHRFGYRRKNGAGSRRSQIMSGSELSSWAPCSMVLALAPHSGSAPQVSPCKHSGRETGMQDLARAFYRNPHPSEIAIRTFSPVGSHFGRYPLLTAVSKQARVFCTMAPGLFGR